MTVVFSVSISYETGAAFSTEDVVSAVRFAAAAAMHSGKSFTVKRSIAIDSQSNATVVPSTTILTVGPSSIDFRRVTADTIIGMKALAHEVVPGIDELLPPIQKEGF